MVQKMVVMEVQRMVVMEMDHRIKMKVIKMHNVQLTNHSNPMISGAKTMDQNNPTRAKAMVHNHPMLTRVKM